MWILPKNYQLSSRFAQDMVESKEDLTLQGLSIESSLMSRSKPIALQTWLRRWKPGNYHQRLFTRILKPSQRTSFETELTLSLAVIPASHFQQQGKERDMMTQDTCGLTLGDTLKQLDLLDASLKMSKDTSRLDSQASSAIWRKMVTEQRGEYSQRKKLAHRIEEKEYLSWPTPTATNNGPGVDKTNPRGIQQGNALATAVLWESKGWWPTPAARDYKGANSYETTKQKIADGKRAQMGQLPNAVMIENCGPGQLNPDWVEWLMGVPTGWTDLGSWETE